MSDPLWSPIQLASLNEMIELAHERYPRAMKACVPRRYLPPPGYLNPRYWGGVMMSHLLANSHDIQVMTKSSASIQMATWQLIKAEVPTYFVAEDYIRAVAATDTPDCLLADLRWPLETMLLALPVSFRSEEHTSELQS